MVVPTQLVAGIAAAAVVNGILPGSLKVGNALGDDTKPVQGVVIEMFLTAQLVLTVYFLAVEKHHATYLAPLGIGIAVFIAHIAGTNYTGTSVNPARSLGPAVFLGFPSYHWIYWIGPILGTFLAFGLYTLMKYLDYSTANPGQDASSTSVSNQKVAADSKPQEHALRVASQRSHATLIGSPAKSPAARLDTESDEDLMRGRGHGASFKPANVRR